MVTRVTMGTQALHSMPAKAILQRTAWDQPSGAVMTRTTSRIVPTACRATTWAVSNGGRQWREALLDPMRKMPALASNVLTRCKFKLSTSEGSLLRQPSTATLMSSSPKSFFFCLLTISFTLSRLHFRNTAFTTLTTQFGSNLHFHSHDIRPACGTRERLFDETLWLCAAGDGAVFP